jgi:ligand-binding sensor domain-containing protein
MTETIMDVPGGFKIGYGEISDIAVDDKEIWLSCGKRGIVCYDRVLEKWAHFTTDNGLVFNTAHCLALSQGMVWCGLGEKGRGAVMAYDRRDKKWFFYHHPAATTTAVTSLALDGDNLWVGNDEGTIAILNTKDFSWRILHQDKKGYTSTVEDIFVCKDTVWVACNVNGIRRYNRETKEWKIWDWDEPDLDCSLALKCITVDGGDIWVGGNGGVYKLDTLSDRFTKVDAGRFLKLSGASSIAVSDRFIWFINPGTLYNTIVHIKGGIVEDALKVDVK